MTMIGLQDSNRNKPLGSIPVTRLDAQLRYCVSSGVNQSKLQKTTANGNINVVGTPILNTLTVTTIIEAKCVAYTYLRKIQNKVYSRIWSK